MAGADFPKLRAPFACFLCSSPPGPYSLVVPRPCAQLLTQEQGKGPVEFAAMKMAKEWQERVAEDERAPRREAASMRWKSARKRRAPAAAAPPPVAGRPRGYPLPTPPMPPPPPEDEEEKKKEDTARHDEIIRRTLGIPDDEPDKVAALSALGISPQQIAAANRESKFGPRGGLSAAARLLRALRYPLLLEGTLLGRLVVPLDG